MKSTGKALLTGLAILFIMGVAVNSWCQAPKPEEMPTTIEVNWTWDFLPGITRKPMLNLLKKQSLAL
jgi:hypothetical protein